MLDYLKKETPNEIKIYNFHKIWLYYWVCTYILLFFVETKDVKNDEKWEG